jgi:hypothetical protein
MRNPLEGQVAEEVIVLRAAQKCLEARLPIS